LMAFNACSFLDFLLGRFNDLGHQMERVFLGRNQLSNQ
jgi:hypothetical protein